MSGLTPVTISVSFPLGTVVPYAGHNDLASRDTLAKSGWLICDGGQIDRNKYKALYQVIGDIHGRGDAVTTFNLPDYRGRFLRGVDDGAGRDPDVAQRMAANPGGWTANMVGSVQGDAFREHSHTVVQMIANNKIDGVDSTTTYSGEHHNEERQSALRGGAETRPVNAYVHWLILAGAPSQ